MASGLNQILERQRQNGYAGFRGTSIKGRLPIREGLLNELIREGQAKKGGGSFRINQLSIQDNNILALNVTVEKWLFSKTLTIALAIDPIIDFPRSPFLKIRPAQSLGLLGTVIEIALTAINLPGAITVSPGQNIAVNLKAVLESAGRADLVPLIQGLGVTTQPGVLYLDFRLGIV
jgi:hypothetical protein